MKEKWFPEVSSVKSLIGPAVIVGTSLWVLYKYARFKWAVAKGFNAPNLEPPSFPLGNLLLLGDYLGFLERIHDSKDATTGLASVWLGVDQCLLLHKAEHAHKILSASSYRKELPTLAVHFEAILGPKNLTALMNDEWRQHRSLMSKPFQFSQLKTMAASMVSVANRLTDYMVSLPHTQEIEALGLLRLATMDIIGLTAFGYDFGCVANAAHGPTEEMKAFEYLLDEHTRRLTSLNPLDKRYAVPTSANRRHNRCNKILRNRIDGIIRQRRQQQLGAKPSESAAEAADFLTHMLTARDDDGVSFSDSDLSDELVTLMFAGFDTTSLALSFAVHILATQPEIQAELHTELDGVLHGRSPTYDDYNALKYTLQVVKESLRLYPPAPLTSRYTTSDVTLEPGLVIPAGTHCWIPMVSIQRSPLNWDAPLQPRPERFAAGQVVPPGAWLPFSGGQRNCIGMRFALLEATLVLAVLAQRFSFSSKAPVTLPCRMCGVIQKPANGVYVTLTPRPWPSHA